MSELPPDETIPRAVKAACVLGGVFTLAALGLFGGRSAFSVAVGAGIGIANLVAMRAIIRNLLRPPPDEEPAPETASASPVTTTPDDRAPESLTSPAPEKQDAKPAKTAEDHRAAGKRGGVAWGVFAVLKMVLLFGSVAILLTRGMVDPMALVVGYGVLPLGIALGSLWGSLRPNG